MSADDTDNGGGDEADIYQNCTTDCPNCMRTCDQQTKADGSHPGLSHHCPTHGSYT